MSYTKWSFGYREIVSQMETSLSIFIVKLKFNIIVLQVNMMMLPVGNILLHLTAGDAAIFPRPYRSYHAMNQENEPIFKHRNAL